VAVLMDSSGEVSCIFGSGLDMLFVVLNLLSRN
jgi:hypothetical protein